MFFLMVPENVLEEFTNFHWSSMENILMDVDQYHRVDEMVLQYFEWFRMFINTKFWK